MIGLIAFLVFAFFALLSWIMTAVCMKVDWIFVSGVNLLPKADRQKYKEKHDMRAMNRFIGKRIFMPLAVLFTIIAPISYVDAEWMQSAWFGVLLVIVVIATLVMIFTALPKILGNKFEK